MGRGEAKRRRQKNAQAAKHGKLSKVALPSDVKAPGSQRRGKKRKGAAAEDDDNAGLPRKLRELLKLKAFAEQQEAEAKALALKRHAEDHDAEEAQHEDDNGQEKDQGPSTSEVKEEDAPEESRATAGGTKGIAKGTTSGKGQLPSEAPPGGTDKAHVPSRARQKKKEWKRLKKQKLMEKKDRAAEPDPNEVDWEASTKPETVRFGEVAAQPPTFNLKQRHWDPRQKSSRIQDIFAKQMSDAKKAARKNVGVPDVGAMSEHDAALRLQLIEGYRQNRRGGGGDGEGSKPRGPATLQSLKSLVHASSAAAGD